MDDSLYFIIAVIIIVPIIMTFLLAKKYKKNKLPKYIPSIISFLIGILLYSAAQSQTGFLADVGYLIFALISFIIFIVAIITALLCEFTFQK